MATKNELTKNVVEVKNNCPGCTANEAELLQMRPTRLCPPCIDKQTEIEMINDTVAPAATITMNATTPEVAELKEEPIMATKKTSQPKAAAPKKTAVKKAATPKTAEPKAKATKKAAAPKMAEVVELPKAAKAPKARKSAKTAVAPVVAEEKQVVATVTAKGARGVQKDRMAAVAAAVNKLLADGTRELVKIADVREAISKDELQDRLLRRALRHAARAGMLRKVAQGTYARA